MSVEPARHRAADRAAQPDVHEQAVVGAVHREPLERGAATGAVGLLRDYFPVRHREGVDDGGVCVTVRVDGARDGAAGLTRLLR